MSYMDIDNLYKNQDILLFKECYALEKIHGTSAHISFKRGLTPNQIADYTYSINFFSGGEKHENFIKLFDEKFLLEKFKELNINEMVIFGEAYGGKCQGMSATYGKELRFIAFEVNIGHNWVSVPQAEEIVKQFGLEFVSYRKLPTDLTVLNDEITIYSIQAVRNGMGEGHMREGIVLRPLIEVTKNNGERIIAKHKTLGFQETKTPREVSPDKLKVLEEANAIAEEWVTLMRLNHILDKIESPSIEKMGEVIKAMVEDIEKEGKGEIKESKEARKAIGKKTVLLFKTYLQKELKG